MQVVDNELNKNMIKLIANSDLIKTSDADKAFDEFCKKYLNSSTGFINNYSNNNRNNNSNINTNNMNIVSANNNIMLSNCNNHNHYIYQTNSYHNKNPINMTQSNTFNVNNGYLYKESQNLNIITNNNVQLRNNDNNLMHDPNYLNRRNSQIISYDKNNKHEHLNCLYNSLFHKSNDNILKQNNNKTFNLNDKTNNLQTNCVNNINNFYNNRNSVVYVNTNFNAKNTFNGHNSGCNNHQLNTNIKNENHTINCKKFNSIKLKEIYNKEEISKDVLAQLILDLKRKSSLKNPQKSNFINPNNQNVNHMNSINQINQNNPMKQSISNQNCQFNSKNVCNNTNIYNPVPSLYSNFLNTTCHQNEMKINNKNSIKCGEQQKQNIQNTTKIKQKQTINLRNLKSSSNSTNQLKRLSLVNEQQFNKIRSANTSLIFNDLPANTNINNSTKNCNLQIKSANSIRLSLLNENDKNSNQDYLVIDENKSNNIKDEAYIDLIKSISNCNNNNLVNSNNKIIDSNNSNKIINQPTIKLAKSDNNSCEKIEKDQGKKQPPKENLLKSEVYSFVKHKLVSLGPLNSNRCITPPPPPTVIKPADLEKNKKENVKQIDETKNQCLIIYQKNDKEQSKDSKQNSDLNLSNSNFTNNISKTPSSNEKSLAPKPDSMSSISTSSTSSASTTSSANNSETSNKENNDEKEKLASSLIVSTNLANINMNVKDEALVFNKEVSEFVAPKNEPNEKINPSKVNGPMRLGFKVFACGMSKMNPRLPIPKENFFLDRGDFGDDAGFFSENTHGHAIGIADGATGNAIYGYDPGDFSRNLMKACSEFFYEENKSIDAKTLLMKAYDAVQEKTCYGSSTACVITLDYEENTLSAANVGDSGYLIIRDGKILHKSEPQRINFICPRQLDSYPWKEKSRKMGISYTNIVANQTECETIPALKDDLVIISSDGLFDNLDHSEIEEICSKSKTICDAVETMVFRSVKYYRKPDDILVICGKIIENKNSLNQHKYTQDPYLV